MIAQVAMSQLEVQLTNRIVTTPCCVRMDNSYITADFELPDRKVSVEFALVGGKLVMVVRDMAFDGVTVKSAVLNDFRETVHKQLDIALKKTGDCQMIDEYKPHCKCVLLPVESDDFSVQAAMIAAKQVDDRNAQLTHALAVSAERVLLFEKRIRELGYPVFNSGQWAILVKQALLTSTDPEALRVARLLGGEGE